MYALAPEAPCCQLRAKESQLAFPIGLLWWLMKHQSLTCNEIGAEGEGEVVDTLSSCSTT